MGAPSFSPSPDTTRIVGRRIGERTPKRRDGGAIDGVAITRPDERPGRSGGGEHRVAERGPQRRSERDVRRRRRRRGRGIGGHHAILAHRRARHPTASSDGGIRPRRPRHPRLVSTPRHLARLGGEPDVTSKEHHAHRNPGAVRRDARHRQGEGLRLPGVQRLLLADAQRGAAGAHRGGLRRHHPGHHRRRRLLRRPHRQGPRHGRARVRALRPRGREVVPDHGRAAHRPLPEERARRLRLPAHRRLRGGGQGGSQPDLPVAHVGRLGRAARREPRDRQADPPPHEGDQRHPRGRDRRRRRRGGRRQPRHQRAPLHDPRRRDRDGRGARPRRAGPLHGRPHLRQRARRLRARQREAQARAPQGDPGRPRRPSTAPARSRSTSSSTAARARPTRRSPRRSPTAS